MTGVERLGLQPDPSSMRPISGRPALGEYAPYVHADIAYVVGEDAGAALAAQGPVTIGLFRQFGEVGSRLTYAPDKWSIRQVLGHLVDDERVFAYRALCIARGDRRELLGFDENLYVAGADFDAQPLEALLADYAAVRAASLSLFRGLTPAAWLRRGSVNSYSASARGLAFHIAGHELRHHRVVVERYLPVARALPGWQDA